MYIVKHGDTTDSTTGGILAVISSLGSIITTAMGGGKETPAPIVQEKSSISSSLEWLLPTGLLLIVIISIVSMSKR